MAREKERERAWGSRVVEVSTRVVLNLNLVPEPTLVEREMYLNRVTQSLIPKIPLDRQKLAKIKAIQIVPCGKFEGENVQGILESHKNQTLLPEEKMLVLFVNGKEGAEDITSQHIERFKAENPELNIVLLPHTWQNRYFSMGMARAIPNEVIQQIWETDDVGTDPVLVSNDADCFDLQPNYLKIYTQKIQKGVYGGNISRFENSKTNFLYDLNLMLGVIDRAMRNYQPKHIKKTLDRKELVPPGSNTAYLLSNYQNYALDKNKGEDRDFSERLEIGGAKMKYISSVKVYSDPRRIINHFNRGNNFHQTWKDWEGDGSNGREQNELKPQEYTLEEIQDYLNNYFRTRLELFIVKNYHNGDAEMQIKQANLYVNQMIKYLKIGLQQNNLLPEAQINLLKQVEGVSFEDNLKKHNFVTLNTPNIYKKGATTNANNFDDKK